MISHDGSHDFEHAKRVAANTKQLISDQDPLYHCAMACAWLHDVCDKKYTNPERAIKTINRHCRRQKFAHSSLLEQVIKNVSYSKLRLVGPPQLDEIALKVWNIVSQSDMIEALGITGIMRTLLYQGSRNNHISGAIGYIKNSLLDCAHYITINPIMEKEALQRKKSMLEWLNAFDQNNKSVVELSVQFVLFGKRCASFDEAVVYLNQHTSQEASHFYFRFCEEEAFSSG